jgi:beta-glucanase (GH16 family)
LEGYSEPNPNYFKFRLARPLGFWNIQTNVHYVDGGKGRMLGPKTHWFGWKSPTDNFINYRLVWREDLLEFWYAGRLVRRVTDPKILNQLAKTKMNLIINNGVTANVDQLNPPNSTFTIKSFTYTPF